MNGCIYIYLSSVSDPTRLRILSLVNALPGICVCQLMEIMGLPQTTISKALGVLKKAGLVKDKRSGQWIRYNIGDLEDEFPLKKIMSCASLDLVVRSDLKKLNRIKKIPLDKICCNKPWRK